LAAYLNHFDLVKCILELDGYLLTLDAIKHNINLKVRDRAGIASLPDCKGRLPIDIVYWKRETMIWHIKHELYLARHKLSGSSTSRNVVRKRLSVRPELIAKLSPVGEATARWVEQNIDAPVEACFAQISSFILFQSLVIIEMMTNTVVWEVFAMCACSLFVVIVLGVWLYVNFRLHGSSSLMPVYFFYSRLLLAMVLYFKSFWAYEQVDYSSLFLGIATLFEDLRTINEGVDGVCKTYGRRIVVPWQKDVEPWGSRLMGAIEGPLPSCGQRAVKCLVGRTLEFAKMFALGLIYLTRRITLGISKVYRVLFLRGVLPKVLCYRSRDAEQQMGFDRYWERHSKRTEASSSLGGAAVTLALDDADSGDDAERPPFTDVNCGACNPCGKVWCNTRDAVTHAYVRRTLAPYKLENPDYALATEKVDLFINTWCTCLTGDLFFVASALGLALCGVGGDNCLAGDACINCGPFMTAGQNTLFG